MNTSESGGGIYQDITGLTINPGDTYCASAFVRTQYPGTGANGIFALWMTDNKIEGSQISFGNLGNLQQLDAGPDVYDGLGSPQRSADSALPRGECRHGRY